MSSVRQTLAGTACLAVTAAFLMCSQPVFAQESGSSWVSNLAEKARQGAVFGKIKAALLDRKDIASRYIRINYDGTTVQLAGFVQNEQQGKEVAAIVQQQATNAVIRAFWVYEEQLEAKDPYKTHVGEQAADAELWTKVKASLCSPAAQGVLAHADVQAVDVHLGVVRVFLILDAPPDNPDIAPYVKPIPGVAGLECRIVKTYQ